MRSSLSNLDQDWGLNPSREFASALGGNKGTVFLKMRRMSGLEQVLGHLAPYAPTLRPIRPWGNP